MSKKEETGLALVPVKQYVAMVEGISSMQEVVEENLGGDQLKLAKVKVPAGGGVTWEIPTSEGVTSEPVIEGIIVAHRNVKVYYDKPFTGGNEPPICSSKDGIFGDGDPLGCGTPGRQACAKCPNNQFGTKLNAKGEKTGAKACSDKKLLYVLLKNRLLPIEVVVPSGSLKGVGEYLSNLTAEGKPISRIVTRLKLEKAKSSDGITYSQVIPEKAAEITEEEEKAFLKQYSANIRELVKTLAVGADYEDEAHGDAFGQSGQGA